MSKILRPTMSVFAILLIAMLSGFIGGVVVGGCQAISWGIVVEGIDGALIFWSIVIPAGFFMGVIISMIVAVLNRWPNKRIVSKKNRWWISAMIGACSLLEIIGSRSNFYGTALAICFIVVAITSAVISDYASKKVFKDIKVEVDKSISQGVFAMVTRVILIGITVFVTYILYLKWLNI